MHYTCILLTVVKLEPRSSDDDTFRKKATRGVSHDVCVTDFIRMRGTLRRSAEHIAAGGAPDTASFTD